MIQILERIIGLITAICGPLLKATKAITELTSEIKFFRQELNEMKQDNKEFQSSASDKHLKIHKRIDENGKKIEDHEKRIIILEQGKDE